MRVVDLHIHTTASDGQYTPAEVVKMAEDKNIEIISITDHDTFMGINEAKKTAKKVQIINGIELSAAEHKQMHILGYNYDLNNKQLIGLCKDMEISRNLRKYKIIDFLNEKGVAINLSEVEALAGGNIIGRPHFAQVMVNKGFVSTTKEAFEKYLDTEDYQKIERKKPNAQMCIDTIKNAGGHAVLAHPALMKKSFDEIENIVVTLRKYGLDGIEAHYTKHTQEETQVYLSLAKKYDLFVTAGSDFHGEKMKTDVSIRGVSIDMSWIDILK